jgi:CO/xanthine dehydrogenase FAD-binding subunit
MATLIKHRRDSRRRMNFLEGDARHYDQSRIRNSGSIGNGACRARLVKALVEFHAYSGGQLELAGAIVS